MGKKTPCIGNDTQHKRGLRKRARLKMAICPGKRKEKIQRKGQGGGGSIWCEWGGRKRN